MVNLKRNFTIGNIFLNNFIYLNAFEKEIVRIWRNDKRINKSMFTDHIINISEHRKFMCNLKKSQERFFWLARNKKNEYLGVVYLEKVKLKDRNAFLGIYANPNSNLTGKGKKLMHCLISIAFKYAKLHTLKLEVFEDNKKAIDLYKKLGFLKEGSLKEFAIKKGKYKDVIIMGKLN